MIPSSLIAAEQELRRIIERRQAGDVSKYLTAYGEIVGCQVRSMLPDNPMRLEICERARSVLDWAGLMLHTRRSLLAEDLRLLQKTHRFLGAELLGTEPGANPHFRLDL